MSEIEANFREVYEKITALKNSIVRAKTLNVELFGFSEQLIFQSAKIKNILVQRSELIAKMEKEIYNSAVQAAKKELFLNEKGSAFYNAISVKYGASRQRKNVTARASAFYLMHEYGYTHKQMYTCFKKRDHSTIIHNIKTAKDMLFTKDKFFLLIFNEIKELFYEIYMPNIDKNTDLCTQ